MFDIGMHIHGVNGDVSVSPRKLDHGGQVMVVTIPTVGGTIQIGCFPVTPPVNQPPTPESKSIVKRNIYT